LPKAREWLVADSFQRYPIHKIATMAGFKSAAHFSRMFKSTYSVSPKEYRANHVSSRLPPEAIRASS
jgi:transcriptional regulator GlxA family with amidase domain